MFLTFAAQFVLADAYTWNTASGNWSDPASWSPNTGTGGPLPADSVTLSSTGASSDPGTVNNVVDLGFAGVISGLTYNPVSATPYIYDVTQIPSGQSLIVTNQMLVGGLNEPAGPYLTYAILTGGGTLLFSGSNLAVENYGTSAGANTYANFDLSALNNFIYDNTNGILSIADTTQPQTSGSLNVRAGGNLYLAAVSNYINVATINLATCSAPQGGPLSTIVLGSGTNVINVGQFNVSNNKNPGNVIFSGPDGGLKIGGVGGANARANITIGNRNVGSGTGTTPGQMLLNGHPVDVLANTLTVGEVSTTSGPSSASNGGEFGKGLLQFDTGVIDASSVVMGYNSAPNANGGLSGVTSELTVGSDATLRVGAGGLILINQAASNVCSSVLTISNGTLVCNGDITAVTNAAAGTGASAQTNIINLVGTGTLSLGAGAVAGTTNFPIDQINVDANATLQFAAPSGSQPSIAVNTLIWPVDDSALTIAIGGLPATAAAGTQIPLIQFSSMSGGTFTAPSLILPSGVTGNLSLSGNTIWFTVTSSVFPTLSTISPGGLITLCTNTTLSCTASSTDTTITNVEVIVQSEMLGGITTNIMTNTLNSPDLTVTGLGTGLANISYNLATNTFYLSVIVKVTDGNGVTISEEVKSFDTIVPSLVIEASDFNYSSGLFMDTPVDGGLWLFANQIGTQGIDENKNTSKTTTPGTYRPSDPVIIHSIVFDSTMPVEQKFVSAAANGNTDQTEQEVGYNSVGDWVNYTRTFGPSGSAPAGTYNVWCYLATSGSGVQAAFSQVTSDATQQNQTTNLLGYFGTASFSDDSFTHYVYVPLVDEFGNRVSINVASGQQTFKSTVLGNPNLAFYVFVPVAPVLTPTLQYNYPDGSVPFQATNNYTFVVSPANGAPISSSGIHLTINGTDVSSQLSLAQSGGIWTATYPLQSNALYTAFISVTNDDGLPMPPHSVSFDTFSIDNYQWEAVDYDYSTVDGSGNWTGGQFIDNPVPSCDINTPQTGELAANSYFGYPAAFSPGVDPYGMGAVAQQGIDINFPNTQPAGNAYYRADGVGSQPATDYLRPKFIAAQQSFSDPNIGQLNIGYFANGNWLNYTRHYPTNTFNVWARLAGGAGPFSGTTLSVVTSGVGTSNQTTTVLGSFGDANPAGWQTYHWIPLLDTNGNKVVVQLGGQETLRVTSGNNLNALYFMLTPTVAVAQNFTISAASVGGQIQISIPTQTGFTYILLHADSLPATSWTQVGDSIVGDDSVHVVNEPMSSQGYYRVMAQ